MLERDVDDIMGRGIYGGVGRRRVREQETEIYVCVCEKEFGVGRSEEMNYVFQFSQNRLQTFISKRQ